MKDKALLAGAAAQKITPAPGIQMGGWAKRASGDGAARYVHDDIHVKAIYVKNAFSGWFLISAEVGAVDSLTVERVRKGVQEVSGIPPEAVMVCATHCHCAPLMTPVAIACSPEEFRGNSVDGQDGRIKSSWDPSSPVKPGVAYTGGIDESWKSFFVEQSVRAAHKAFAAAEPAEISYGEAEVRGAGSSRRVILKDGRIADPRDFIPEEGQISSVSEIDPLLRSVFFRRKGSDEMISVFLNYGSHPWLFPISGISAELSGAVSQKITRSFKGSPLAVYTAGPEGDVALIWNLDIDNLWKTRPGESPAESLERRETAFGSELERLSGIFVRAAYDSLERASPPSGEGDVLFRRKEIPLPFKKGYRHLPSIPLAGWQKTAPEGFHLTELQVLKAGSLSVLGLPGEPFASVGLSIRKACALGELVIAALSNDGGAVTYIPDEKAYSEGGYEPSISCLDREAAGILTSEAVKILRQRPGHI